MGSAEKGDVPEPAVNGDKQFLVTTKFAPPKLNTGVIDRERLIKKLTTLEEMKLLIIAARAGFGKTTLMAQYRKKVISAGNTAIWISLSSGDQNWIYSWTHFVGAFHAAGFLTKGEAFGYDDRAQVRAVMLLILEAIAEHVGEVYLFIDDFDKADSDTQGMIQSLIDLSTDNLHVAIASREVVSFPLGKLRAENQVIEISEELKFNLDESRLFLHNRFGPTFSEHQVRRIHEECGGWPVSLQLIAHSLKHRNKNELAAGELNYRAGNLRKYINDEIFARMSEQELEIWQNLSICYRFNADIACALAQPIAPDVVQNIIMNDQLLLSAVDLHGASPWFRFLPLFAEMLHDRLLRINPGALPALHEKAAKWFADRGFVLEAIRHARQSPGTTQLEELLDQMPMELRSLRWADAIRDMLSDVDPSAFKSRRGKAIASWALFASGSPSRGEAWARQAIAEDADGDHEFAMHQRALKATIAFYHDDSDEFFRIYDTMPPDANRTSILRHGMGTEAMTFLNALGRYEEVRSFFNDRVAADEMTDDWVLILQAFRAVSYLHEGDIHEGLDELKLVMDRAVAAIGDRSTVANFCASYMAAAYYELGMMTEARQVLSGRDAGLHRLSPDPSTIFCVYKSRVMREYDGPAEAMRYLDDCINSRRDAPGQRSHAWLVAEAAKHRMRSQGLNAANGYRVTLTELAAKVEGEGGVCAEIVALHQEIEGRAWLKVARHDEATVALGKAYEYAVQFRQLAWQVRVGLLKCVALHGQGDVLAADQLLVWCIETAQKFDLVRTFQDELPDVGPILAARVAHLKISSTTRTYLDLLRTPGMGSPQPRRRTKKSAADLFTEREIEVINLLVNSMSNKRIALTLGISPATVKWNLQNIFNKLGLTSRYDVITWARKNLLSA
jgi:LuxR family transcriptional regulator, maltose regulon positive regulatory protein